MTSRSAALHHPTPASSAHALRAVGVLIGAAWLVSVLLQVTGHAGALHHHALIEEAGAAGEPPLWLGIPLFLLAWQSMVAAMMLPASLRVAGSVAASPFVGRPSVALGGFLVAYFTTWTAFGLAAFGGDMTLHRLVDTTPWLAEHPWLIQAAVFGLAGAYQLLPLRYRALEACRHPRPSKLLAGGSFGTGFRVGLGHALDCLVCSWALMLLMFAAGVANLAWMALLAAVMAYEALGRHGARFGRWFGVVLLGLAALVLAGVPS